MFVGIQPIRIQHFLKVNCLSFLKILLIFCKMSIKKHLNFLELLNKKKEKNPINFLIGEIDVNTYLIHNFLDVFIVQNRVIRLSKGLFRETYSINEFTFEPSIAYHSFNFTAELHLTRKKFKNS